jgi:hypothetical protein
VVSQLGELDLCEGLDWLGLADQSPQFGHGVIGGPEHEPP